MHFVGEILDRLVVEQGVDGLGRRLGIGLVHHPAVLDAPVGDHDRVDDVTDHGDEGDRGVERPEVEQQDQADDHNRESGGDEVESRHPQHEFDALGAAFNRPRQAAGLAPEMEAQAEFVQVAEGLQRHRADAVLADENEQRRADFLTALCQQSRQAKGRHQPDQQRQRGIGEATFTTDGVDRRGKYHRGDRQKHLPHQDRQPGQHEQQAQARPVRRPQVPQQRESGQPWLAVVLVGCARRRRRAVRGGGAAVLGRAAVCSSRSVLGVLCRSIGSGFSGFGGHAGTFGKRGLDIHVRTLGAKDKGRSAMPKNDLEP